MKIINKEDKSLMELLFCVNQSVAIIPLLLPFHFIRHTYQPTTKKESEIKLHASGSGILQIKGKIQREKI